MRQTGTCIVRCRFSLELIIARDNYLSLLCKDWFEVPFNKVNISANFPQNVEYICYYLPRLIENYNLLVLECGCFVIIYFRKLNAYFKLAFFCFFFKRNCQLAFTELSKLYILSNLIEVSFVFTFNNFSLF